MPVLHRFEIAPGDSFMRSAASSPLFAIVLFGAFLGVPALVNAQTKNAPPPLAKAAPLPAGQAAVQEFTNLMQQRRQFEQKMEQLGKEYEAADGEGKRKIQQSAQPLMMQFQQTTLPRLLALAPIAFEHDPKQLDAGDIVLQMAFANNQYDRAAQVADQLVRAGHRTPEVLNFGGAAEFARHNFARSQQFLEAAQKIEKLDENVGGMFLEASKKYPEYWQQEQQIRAQESQAGGNQALPLVEFTTNRGKIVLELFENQAPNTVANFISLVEKKTYDGTKFHRVIPNFMVQGGDPNSIDNDPSDDGQGGPGYTIPCECFRKDARRHFRGSLSMAHGGKDTGGSQFFITHLPAYWLNFDSPEHHHTVFGRVATGMEVVDATERGDQIVSARVLRKRNHPYQPKTQPEKAPAQPRPR
jgi:cyclophilin family peptidyl-prolyl cis-trans isomerase